MKPSLLLSILSDSHDLLAHYLGALDRLSNQLLQGVLLRSDRAGPDHLVHQRIIGLAQHGLREDG